MKIVSRTGLNVGTELIIDEPNRTIALAVAGNLVAKDGVTLQALYSKLIDLWTTETYQDSPFPMYAIDVLSGQFQIGTDGATYNGWKFLNDATRTYIRDAGWVEYLANGTVAREYVGIVSLGTVSAGTQLYYQRDAADAPSNFTFTDAVNEGIQVYGDATNGNFDKRTFFRGFCREPSKRFTDSVLGDTGKTSTGAFLVNLLLSNEADLKISDLDAEMANAPYSGITVTYFATDQSKTIGGGSYPFRKVINGNGATLEQIYTKCQYLLRQATDIDAGAGTVTGKTADALCAFVGDTLVTNTSVIVENVAPADLNRIEFKDQNGVTRTHPYVAALALQFNANLTAGGAGYYRVYYTTLTGAGNDYGEAGAVTLLDNSDVAMAGTITGSAINLTYDFDNDTAGGGRTAGAEFGYTVVAGNPGYGKPVVATGTMTRSKSNSASLVAETDRAYKAA